MPQSMAPGQTMLVKCLVLLVVAAHCCLRSSALPCERSGYCSLGRTKPYLGEVDTSKICQRPLCAT